MDVSIIVCTYNRAGNLRNVLRDLKALVVPDGIEHEILVVDNNSTDDTRAAVLEAEAASPGLFKYIFEPRQGKSFALNSGVDAAKGEILAFTDDDVEIDRNWLAAICRSFESHDCAGIGGRILPVWTSEKPWWYEEEGPFRLMVVIVKLDFGEQACELRSAAWGANVAFRRRAFEQYGKFRIDLGPTADSLLRGEDSEFWGRLVRGGEKLVYEPAALVFHPVEEKRTRQPYFLKWYFDYGRTTARREEIPPGAKLYFHIPRYLYRQLLEYGAKWIFCTNRKRRFYYKLQTYLTAGVIVETRAKMQRPVA